MTYDPFSEITQKSIRDLCRGVNRKSITTFNFQPFRQVPFCRFQSISMDKSGFGDPAYRRN